MREDIVSLLWLRGQEPVTIILTRIRMLLLIIVISIIMMNHQYHASNSKLLLHSTDIQSPNHLTRFSLFYCGGISTTALSSKYLRSSYNSSNKRDIFHFLTLPYSNGRTYCRFVELGGVQLTSPMCGGDFA